MAIMYGAKHVWKDNSDFKGKADAEKVQQEISIIAAQDPNGKCQNKALVDFARNHPLSESHKCFEWDDTKAAENYRLQQATRIKCQIITVASPVKKPTQNTQTIKVVTNHSLPTPGEGHKDIEVIIKSKSDSAALEQDMYDNLRLYAANFEKRYYLVPSSANIIQQLQAIIATLP